MQHQSVTKLTGDAAQLVMKDILTGSQKLAKIRPAESMEVARLEEKAFHFLYQEDKIFFMMVTHLHTIARKCLLPRVCSDGISICI